MCCHELILESQQPDNKPDYNSFNLVCSSVTLALTLALGSIVSDWHKVQRGCPQGSAFSPLIWNIYQNDLNFNFSINSDINLNMYADDHQFYVVGDTCAEVYDFLKGKLDKYETLVLGNKTVLMDKIVVDNYEVKFTKFLKLLGVSIDDILVFSEHISNM